MDLIPDPIVAYDALAGSYDTLYRSHLCLAENRLIFNRLARHREGESVIDLGCGTGLALEYWTIPSGSYLGVDASPGMLAVARAKFPKHRFERGRIESLPGHHRATSVISLWALSHLPDLNLVAQKVHDLLWPGGRFFVVLHGMAYRYSATLQTGLRQVGQDPGCIMQFTWPAVKVQACFRRLFVDVGIQGFNCRAETLPCSWPVWLLWLYLELEMALLNGRQVDACQYLIVTGRRGEGIHDRARVGEGPGLHRVS